jgi:hypothetical protein
MPLTDVKIRQAKATDKVLKLTDAAGLYLEVKPNGSKLWRYRYRNRRQGEPVGHRRMPIGVAVGRAQGQGQRA